MQRKNRIANKHFVEALREFLGLSPMFEDSVKPTEYYREVSQPYHTPKRTINKDD